MDFNLAFTQKEESREKKRKEKKKLNIFFLNLASSLKFELYFDRNERKKNALIQLP